MKKTFIYLLIFWSSLNFANEPTYDYVILQNGKYVQGQVVNIGKNHIKINVDTYIKSIKNRDILYVTFDQGLTSNEKYRLGFLDGKRFARNQMGNLLLGMPSIFLAGAPLLFIYATSNQKPYNLGINKENKLIIDDPDYLKGYKRGAKQKSVLRALEGGAYGVLIIAIILFSGPSIP